MQGDRVGGREGRMQGDRVEGKDRCSVERKEEETEISEGRKEGRQRRRNLLSGRGNLTSHDLVAMNAAQEENCVCND